MGVGHQVAGKFAFDLLWRCGAVPFRRHFSGAGTRLFTRALKHAVEVGVEAALVGEQNVIKLVYRVVISVRRAPEPSEAAWQVGRVVRLAVVALGNNRL